VLVNNAGTAIVGGRGTFGRHWDRQFDVNVKSVYLMCRPVVPLMPRRVAAHHQHRKRSAFIAFPASGLLRLEAAVLHLSRSLGVRYARPYPRQCALPWYHRHAALSQLSVETG
jgi:NAD(P)-dependent dehydrogenase (short-subunit alcohol dehydrogenase family)